MPCPICRKTTDPKLRPFCSQRCADIDLGRWLTGSYALPLQEEITEEDLDALTREAPQNKPH